MVALTTNVTPKIISATSSYGNQTAHRGVRRGRRIGGPSMPAFAGVTGKQQPALTSEAGWGRSTLVPAKHTLDPFYFQLLDPHSVDMIRKTNIHDPVNGRSLMISSKPSFP